MNRTPSLSIKWPIKDIHHKYHHTKAICMTPILYSPHQLLYKQCISEKLFNYICWQYFLMPHFSTFFENSNQSSSVQTIGERTLRQLAASKYDRKPSWKYSSPTHCNLRRKSVRQKLPIRLSCCKMFLPAMNISPEIIHPSPGDHYLQFNLTELALLREGS